MYIIGAEDYSIPYGSFKNSKDIEIGRIAEHDSEWISKLMDIEILTLKGTCVDVPKKFNSGMHNISPSLAFTHPTSRQVLPSFSPSPRQSPAKPSDSYRRQFKRTQPMLKESK